MKGDKAYRDWRKAINERLSEIYCITAEDAGFVEEYLVSQHWQSNEKPLEFVEWFGNKFDLDPLPSYVRPPQRGG